MESFCDLDLSQLKRSVEKDEDLIVSLGLGEKQYSDFSVIVFDTYLWRMTGMLEERLKALLALKKKLVCFCSYDKVLALKDIRQAVGEISDLGWIQMPEIGETIRQVIKKMAE